MREITCCTLVFLLFLCFPLVDGFPSVLVYNPDFFSRSRFVTFEQRYTIVVFICILTVRVFFFRNCWNLKMFVRHYVYYWCILMNIQNFVKSMHDSSFSNWNADVNLILFDYNNQKVSLSPFQSFKLLIDRHVYEEVY